MKTIVRILFILFWSLIQNDLQAQLNPPGEQQNTSTLKTGSYPADAMTVGSSGNSGAGLYNVTSSLGKESSLYFNDWSPGQVVLKDNTEITDRMLRYDIYHRQMQFACNGDTAAFGNPGEIETITFNDHTFIYDEFLCKDGKRKDFLELLADGDYRLLLYRCISVKYIEECSEPGYESRKEQYFETEKYFISMNHQTAVPLPEKRNDLIAVFADKDKDIKSFIKDNNIKLNQQADLVKLVKFYNQE
jgi:hypothetical protein